MTRKEIIAMAEESGFSKQGRAPAYYAMPDEIERFAALIASRVAAAAKAEEREACANVVDKVAQEREPTKEQRLALHVAADAIRARSQE